MPSGEEEEIVDRGDPAAFLIAPAAVRAFFVFLTNIPSRFEHRVDDLVTILQSAWIAAACRHPAESRYVKTCLQLKPAP
jgi:hypothetical protein